MLVVGDDEQPAPVVHDPATSPTADMHMSHRVGRSAALALLQRVDQRLHLRAECSKTTQTTGRGRVAKTSASTASRSSDLG